MEKQTPEDALDNLRREVDSEIVKSRSNEKEGTRALTAIFMAEETYLVLRGAEGESLFLSRDYYCKIYSETFGIAIKTSLVCFRYYGYVVINNSLALGRVVVRRCYEKGQ